MIQNAQSCPAICITVKCCCPLIKSEKCTLDNSKYTRYNIWHSKDWSALLYQKKTEKTEKNHIVPVIKCLSVYHQWKILVLMQPLLCLLLFIHLTYPLLIWGIISFLTTNKISMEIQWTGVHIPSYQMWIQNPTFHHLLSNKANYIIKGKIELF